MRKAALNIGIICAVFAVAGAVMKWVQFPGGSLLLILGVGIFSLFALPIQMIYNLRRNKNGLRKTADVVGWFGIWFLLFGILYKAQSWPGAYVVMLGGIALTLLFGLLFVLASRKQEVITNWISGFTICTLIILLSVGSAWAETKGDHEIMEVQYSAYHSVLDNCKNKIEEANNGVHQINLIENRTEADNEAMIVAMHGMELINYIDKVKTELVSYSNTGITTSDETDIKYPLDIDYPTLYLVGSEPTLPTGKGLEVYDALVYYKDSMLVGGQFSVPVTDDPVARDQWVKDNFYHATVLEALTRLTKVQTAIAESIVISLQATGHID